MLARPARAEEIPYLKEMLAKSEHEQVDLDLARVWVAEDEGKIVGLLAARMVWQIEPIYLFPEVTNKLSRSRAFYKMYRAFEAWLGDRSRNKTGIHWFFAVTYSPAVKAWAERIGYHRMYKGAATFVKHL